MRRGAGAGGELLREKCRGGDFERGGDGDGFFEDECKITNATKLADCYLCANDTGDIEYDCVFW